MDVLIRYWSETSAFIQVHYLNSLFYGHAFAERISKDLVDCFNNLKLVGWLVVFGLNDPLRQNFSLYRVVSQREGEREEKG